MITVIMKNWKRSGYSSSELVDEEENFLTNTELNGLELISVVPVREYGSDFHTYKYYFRHDKGVSK